MVNYPCSFELEIEFEAYHLYDLCELCLPIIEEVGLPSIKNWEIPLDSDPRSEGLEEKLVELRAQKERGDEDAPHLSYFVLGEGGENQGSDLVLRLRYYKHKKSQAAGECGLHIYIHKHNTIEQIQDFIDRAVEFCRKVLDRAEVYDVILYRSSGRSYIPNAPLVDDDYQMFFIDPSKIEKYYDDLEVIWDFYWDIEGEYGDRYLVGRCLDMHKYCDNLRYRSEIIDYQWDLIRAAKPGTIKFFSPNPHPSEMDVYKSGEPRLNQVGYITEIKTLEYACYVEPYEHIQGWEIFKIWNLLQDGCTRDGTEIETIRVVFMFKEMAEREKRPLLEAGAKVIYMDSQSQDVEITE